MKNGQIEEMLVTVLNAGAEIRLRKCRLNELEQTQNDEWRGDARE